MWAILYLIKLKLNSLVCAWLEKCNIWSLKVQVESWGMKLKLEVEVSSWDFMLKFEVKVWIEVKSTHSI